MHPLTDNPIYAPCNELISKYEKCNESLWNRFTDKCINLYDAMVDCMHEQRLKRRDENHKKAKLKNAERERQRKELCLDF